MSITRKNGKKEPTSRLCSRSTIMVVGQQGYPSTEGQRDLVHLFTILDNQIVITLTLQRLSQ